MILLFASSGGSGEVAPQITAGPVWTNNQDGTVTVTWTTDIATDSEVNYGTTSSYGSTEDDAAVVTSHSITITGLADDVYHFSVGDIDATYASADALGAVTSALLGHFMIYPHHINADSAAKWFLQANQDGSATGTAWCLRNKVTALGETLNPMWAAFEGAMYPGVVFDYTPDVISGSVSNVTDGFFRFRNLGTIGAYVQWTVPSWVSADNGMPSGLLNSLYVFCNAGGAFNVIRNRGGSDTTIVSAQSPSGTGFFATPCSLSAGNELQAGDTLRIVSSGGTASIVGCVMAYASGGTFPKNGVAHRVMNATAHLQMTQYYGTGSGTPPISTNGSNPDVAWEIAPNGQTKRFTGGADHQGPAGTYGQETGIVESWTLNGAGWTVTQNYRRANVKMTRSSTAYYDVTYPDMGDMVTSYEARSFDLLMEGYLTPGISLDTGSLYCPMLPIKSFGTAYNTKTGVSPESAAIGTLPKTWTGIDPAVTWASGGSLAAGVGVYQGALSGNTIYDNRYLGVPKNYQRISPLSATATTAAKSGFGRFFSLPAAGPVAPTISATSCTVGSDGRTILIVPVTTTGGITGNTGLTFNVGGSPILLDSTTNNGDGTITCVVSVADTIASADVVTVDVATASLYDAYGIMMAAASGIAVVNESAQ